VVSPDPLSPTPKFRTPMKTPGNTEEDSDDPGPGDKEDNQT